MKTSILLILGLFFFTSVAAQKPREHIAFYDFVSKKNVKEQGQIDKDGFPVGEWNYFLKNGVLEYKINHTTNISKEFYASGQLKSEGAFDPLTGTHIGKWITYYKNGRVQSTGTYDADGKKNSEFITYSENGTIKSTRYFKKGVIQK